jgi:fumarate hydratase class II
MTYNPIHPNDHVNMGQSTNDVFPTAIHVAFGMLIGLRLMRALSQSYQVLREKAENWQNILKIGRTHLADATPLTLGQEFGGLAEQFNTAFHHAWGSLNHIYDLPVGGTAIGTGINTHSEFSERVVKIVNEHLEQTDWSAEEFCEPANHFSANANRDGLVYAHGCLKSIAVTLFNIANNIRWLGSGPRCGFYEVIIPDLQPGSSIMPGKVNPVLCEALMQACARVIGNDQTMTFCGAAGGQFQLNIMMPVMADTAIESVKILSGALEVFTEKCLKGLEANEEKCREGVEKSLSMATALNPYIGYERAAEIAKEAFKTGKTVREVCLDWNVLPPEQLAEVLDPWKMIKPTEPPSEPQS